MKIFRSILDAPQGKFLIDAEYECGAINSLRIHPIVDGIVWAILPLCQMENVEILVSQLRKTIAAIS